MTIQSHLLFTNETKLSASTFCNFNRTFILEIVSMRLMLCLQNEALGILALPNGKHRWL